MVRAEPCAALCNIFRPMIMEEEGVELKFERGNWLGWLPCTGFAWCNPCSAQKLFTLPVHHWHSPWLVDRVPAGHGGVGGGLLQTFPSRYSSWLPRRILNHCMHNIAGTRSNLVSMSHKACPDSLPRHLPRAFWRPGKIA